MKGVAQKRTYSIRFEITPHEWNQLRQMGHAQWPNERLIRDELCRRLLLAQVPAKAEGHPLGK